MGQYVAVTGIVGIKITEEDEFDYFDGETEGLQNVEYFEDGGPFDVVEFDGISFEYPVLMGTPVMDKHEPYSDGVPANASISGEDLEDTKQRVRETVEKVPDIPDDKEIGYHLMIRMI